MSECYDETNNVVALPDAPRKATNNQKIFDAHDLAGEPTGRKKNQVLGLHLYQACDEDFAFTAYTLIGAVKTPGSAPLKLRTRRQILRLIGPVLERSSLKVDDCAVARAVDQIHAGVDPMLAMADRHDQAAIQAAYTWSYLAVKNAARYYDWGSNDAELGEITRAIRILGLVFLSSEDIKRRFKS